MSQTEDGVRRLQRMHRYLTGATIALIVAIVLLVIYII